MGTGGLRLAADRYEHLRGGAVIVDRSHVVQALRTYGLAQQADRAQRDLDVRVDTERDAETLRDLGLDPDSRAQGGALAVLRDGPAGG